MLLKEKIDTLDIANKDVIEISNTKGMLKADYKKIKKPAALKIGYENKLEDLNNQLDDATTFLTNEYEEFNDYKATNDVTQEKEEQLREIEKKIIAIKSQIANTSSKANKIALQGQLRQLKGQKSDIKGLYSKSMKNKTYLYLTLGISIILILTALLLTFLYVIPKQGTFNYSTTGGIAVITIISLCMVMMVIYVGYIIKNEVKKWALDREKPTISVFLHSVWIFFCDSLGLGAFAVITTVFKKNGVFNDDKKIPGTLNVTRVVASFFGGSLTLLVVNMDIWTLVIMLVAVMVGSFVGTTLVGKIKRKNLVLTMGVILSICAVLMLLSMGRLGVIPNGAKEGLLNKGDEYLMVIAAFVFIGVGMLQAFGIGIYAPTMIAIVLLGMDFVISAPVMMLAAALSAQVNAYTGMRKNNHLPKTSWTMIFGSVVGVFLYFTIIWVGLYTAAGATKETKAMVKEVMQWISIPVIAYAAYLLLKSYWNLRNVPTPKKRVVTLNSFNLESYSVVSKIDYKKANKKANYQKVHW